MAEQNTTHTFNCPQCGGPQVYQAASGALVCDHCGHRETIHAPTAGETAGESEFTEEALAQAEHGWQVEHLQAQCQQCGGGTLLPPGALTQTCPYCGSTLVIGHNATDDLLRPHFMIPFRTVPERCRAITQEWLGSSWMTPRQLRKQANLGDYVSLYAPFWTFDAKVTAGWSAEIGYDETSWDDEGLPETETSWRRQSGQVHVTFDDQYVPGTTHLNETAVEQITNYDLRTLVPYSPAYLAGHHAQAFEVNLNQAWEKAQKRMKGRVMAECERDALGGDGDHVRNVRLRSFEPQDAKWRYILLPVYTSTYRYGKRVYQTLINGQKGTIGGQRPVAWLKVCLVASAPLLPFVLAFLALILGEVDVRKTLDSLPSFVAAVLVVGVIGLLGLAVRRSADTIRQARYIQAADPRKKGSSGS
jgi:ribosomal protein L37AE/L43A